MDLTLLICTALLCLCLITIGFLYYKLKIKASSPTENNLEGNRLKLQSLERIALFAERCKLTNLVSRVDIASLQAADYLHLLTQTIVAEYEYNISQQIYVSSELWAAVTRFKDQNIYIVNQIGANLPPQATALDLGKLIIEYTNTPNAEMSAILLDAIQFEAKKIIN